MTRTAGKAEPTKERRTGRIGRKQGILKMKEKKKVPRWTQLGIRICPESFGCGRIEKGEVAKLHVTTEMCEHRFSVFFCFVLFLTIEVLHEGIHKLSRSFS